MRNVFRRPFCLFDPICQNQALITRQQRTDQEEEEEEEEEEETVTSLSLINNFIYVI